MTQVGHPHLHHLGAVLELGERTGHVWLRRLFGMVCGAAGEPWPAAEAYGFFHLATDRGRVDATRDLRLTAVQQGTNRLTVEQAVDPQGLAVTMAWDLCPETGVLTRRDRVENRSSQPITLRSYRARLAFGAGPYEVYTQDSRWCVESQGAWQPWLQGTLLVANNGRSCQQAAPFAALRTRAGEPGLVAHIVSRGNWQIRARRVAVYRDHPEAFVLELGQAEEDLRVVLAPGEAWEAPLLLFAAAPTGDPAEAAPAVSRWAEAHLMQRPYPRPLVHYNTWFDHYEHLDLDRCKALAEAAAGIGCEVFVVDAGWYGGADRPWHAQTGDWREATHRALRGRLRELADHVRSLGMAMGLWIEPERIYGATPIYEAHPDWFLPSAGPRTDCYYPDLRRDEVYAWVQSEVARIIETYGLRWVKVDCNHDCHTDPSGTEFAVYYDRWYRLLDEWHARFPQVVFEGCSSGGLRHDWADVAHYHTHFLSDTVDPIDVLRISFGTLLRMSPVRINRWPVLTAIGPAVTTASERPGEETEKVLVPTYCTWERAATYSLDFAVRVAMPGSFGLSGNLLSFSPEGLERLAAHVAQYKRWREVIAHSDAYLLTPPEPITERTGWAALQLQARDSRTALLFVYHLHRAEDSRVIALRGLEPGARYRVTDADHPDRACEYGGAELMAHGLRFELPPCSAAFVVIERIAAPEG
ncbi:MAG: alpha-galactosidase [Anaerolineae bacterium]